LIKLELTDLEQLLQKNLVAAPRVNAIRRDAARIEGERGQLTAQIAQANSRIVETEFQIVQIDQDLRTEIVRDLRETQAKESELDERRIAAEDQLKRVEICSPQDGVVHQLAFHTIGGVVSSGEPMMLIGFGARMPMCGTLALQASSSDTDRHRPCKRHVPVGDLDMNGDFFLLSPECSGCQTSAVDAFDAGDGGFDQ
jgi:HlyD family secretion protein